MSEGYYRIRFRLQSGTDLKEQSVPPRSTVAETKQQLINSWVNGAARNAPIHPSYRTDGRLTSTFFCFRVAGGPGGDASRPTGPDDLKIIHAGKVLENSKLLSGLI
jgi:hypothetical protein